MYCLHLQPRSFQGFHCLFPISEKFAPFIGGDGKCTHESEVRWNTNVGNIIVYLHIQNENYGS